MCVDVSRKERREFGNESWIGKCAICDTNPKGREVPWKRKSGVGERVRARVSAYVPEGVVDDLCCRKKGDLD